MCQSSVEIPACLLVHDHVHHGQLKTTSHLDGSQSSPNGRGSSYKLPKQNPKAVNVHLQNRADINGNNLLGDSIQAVVTAIQGNDKSALGPSSWAVQGGHIRLLTGGVGDWEQGRLSRAGKATFSLQA